MEHDVLLVREIFIRDKILFICEIYLYMCTYIYIFVLSRKFQSPLVRILIFVPECHFLETY